MDRRTFLAGTPVALATAAVDLPSLKIGGRRVSCEPGDPGERWYAELCGDGKRTVVYLDGEVQDLAITADEAEGFVLRAVKTPNGNLAYNRVTGEIYKETVHGVVEIRIREF